MRSMHLGISWAILLFAGCNQSSESITIEGYVCTRPELALSSYLTTRDNRGDSVYLCVKRAKVYLAFDKQKNVLPAAVTYSDGQGNYRLILINPPQPTDPDGYYYLVVEKNGFETLVEPIFFGPNSRDKKNSIVLKHVKEGRR
jgi:hypothetical protein